MKMVPIKKAKDQLAALVREVELGAHIVVTRNGQPVADIVPHKPRKGGIDWDAVREWKKERGYTRVAGPIPPDFDDPLPEDFLITPERS